MSSQESEWISYLSNELMVVDAQDFARRLVRAGVSIDAVRGFGQSYSENRTILYREHSLRQTKLRLEIICQTRESSDFAFLGLTDELIPTYIHCGAFVQPTRYRDVLTPSCQQYKICPRCAESRTRKPMRSMLNWLFELGDGPELSLTMVIPVMPLDLGWVVIKQAEVRLKEVIRSLSRSIGTQHPATFIRGYLTRWELSMQDGEPVQHLHGCLKLSTNSDTPMVVGWFAEEWYKQVKQQMTTVCGTVLAAGTSLVHAEPILNDGVNRLCDTDEEHITESRSITEWINYSNKSSPFGGGFDDRYGVGTEELVTRILGGLKFMASIGKRQCMVFSGKFIGSDRKQAKKNTDFPSVVQSLNNGDDVLAVVPYLTHDDHRMLVEGIGRSGYGRSVLLIIVADYHAATYMVDVHRNLGCEILRLDERSAVTDAKDFMSAHHGTKIAVATIQALSGSADVIAELGASIASVVVTDAHLLSHFGHQSINGGLSVLGLLDSVVADAPRLMVVGRINSGLRNDLANDPIRKCVHFARPRRFPNLRLTVKVFAHDQSVAPTITLKLRTLFSLSPDARAVIYCRADELNAIKRKIQHEVFNGHPHSLVRVYGTAGDGTFPLDAYTRVVLTSQTIHATVGDVDLVVIADNCDSLSGLYQRLLVATHQEAVAEVALITSVEQRQRTILAHRSENPTASQVKPVLAVLGFADHPMTAEQIRRAVRALRFTHPHLQINKLFVGQHEVALVRSVVDALTRHGYVERIKDKTDLYKLRHGYRNDTDHIEHEIQLPFKQYRDDHKDYLGILSRGPEATIADVLRKLDGLRIQKESRHQVISDGEGVSGRTIDHDENREMVAGVNSIREL